MDPDAEDAGVAQLLDVLGDVEESFARTLLRRFNGDVQAAIDGYFTHGPSVLDAPAPAPAPAAETLEAGRVLLDLPHRTKRLPAPMGQMPASSALETDFVYGGKSQPAAQRRHTVDSYDDDDVEDDIESLPDHIPPIGRPSPPPAPSADRLRDNLLQMGSELVLRVLIQKLDDPSNIDAVWRLVWEECPPPAPAPLPAPLPRQPPPQLPPQQHPAQSLHPPGAIVRTPPRAPCGRCGQVPEQTFPQALCGVRHRPDQIQRLVDLGPPDPDGRRSNTIAHCCRKTWSSPQDDALAVAHFCKLYEGPHPAGAFQTAPGAGERLRGDWERVVAEPWGNREHVAQTEEGVQPPKRSRPS